MSGFAVLQPDGPLYRLAREPDPWAWPDWAYAGLDGDEDAPPPGIVPLRWLQRRRIGEATVSGSFVDIGDAGSLATLRIHLAARAIHYGLSEIDAATTRHDASHRRPRASYTNGTKTTSTAQASATAHGWATNSSTGRSLSHRPTRNSSCKTRTSTRSNRTTRIYSKRCVCSASNSPENVFEIGGAVGVFMDQAGRRGAVAAHSAGDRSENCLSPVLREERERVASGGVLACTLHEVGHGGRENIGLRQRDAVYGWHDDRGGQRGERQVSRAEALAA